MAITMTTLSSCDAIYDDLDPCPQGVRLRFVYDYNMEFANAFPSQVDCITLLVYDADGKYVTSFTETSDVLKDENWRMEIPLKPGEYSIEAWGGVSCEKTSFQFNEEPQTIGMDALQVSIKPAMMTSPEGKYLQPLFYGPINPMTLVIPEESTEYIEETVYMMRDTNDIRIILQNMNGTQAHGDDFVFSITDDNTNLAYNNDIIPGNSYTYSPWAWGDVSVGLFPDGTEAIDAYAEFCTSRLIYRNDAKLLIQRKSDSKVIVDNIPIINFLLGLRSNKYDWMSPQEFLDRENSWRVIFFLDDKGEWLKTYIKVNDWEVRVNDIVAE